MKLIVGLGNPGKSYDNHKHNIGFWVLDRLAKANRLKWKEGKAEALETWGEIGGTDCTLAKPLTWMNNSGEAVQSLLKEKNLVPEDLIVVHDDIDLKLGTMRWTFTAGHGGHNGVRSIIERIGTQDFYRLRLGIGRPSHVSLGTGMPTDPAEYVLQPFVGEALEKAEALAARAGESIADFLTHGLTWVQNHYH